MSEVGLGRVKTQRCCDDIEWVFRQATFLIVQASWACSVAIDFGKLFSSSFNFSSFYTARVKRRNTRCEQMFSALPLRADIRRCPRAGNRAGVLLNGTVIGRKHFSRYQPRRAGFLPTRPHHPI